MGCSCSDVRLVARPDGSRVLACRECDDVKRVYPSPVEEVRQSVAAKLRGAPRQDEDAAGYAARLWDQR